MRKFWMVALMLALATPALAAKHGPQVGPMAEVAGVFVEDTEENDWGSEPPLVLVGITVAYEKTILRLGVAPMSNAERGFVLEAGYDIKLGDYFLGYIGAGYWDHEPIDLGPRSFAAGASSKPPEPEEPPDFTVDDDGPLYLRAGIRGELFKADQAHFQWGVGIRAHDAGTDRGDIAPWIGISLVTK